MSIRPRDYILKNSVARTSIQYTHTYKRAYSSPRGTDPRRARVAVIHAAARIKRRNFIISFAPRGDTTIYTRSEASYIRAIRIIHVHEGETGESFLEGRVMARPPFRSKYIYASFFLRRSSAAREIEREQAV